MTSTIGSHTIAAMRIERASSLRPTPAPAPAREDRARAARAARAGGRAAASRADSAAAHSDADARARGVQRAGQAPVEERAALTGSPDHRPRARQRCPLAVDAPPRSGRARRRRSERLRGELDAGGVGAGDDPHRRVFAVARGRDQAGAGGQRRAPAGPSGSSSVSVRPSGGEARVDAARARALRRSCACRRVARDARPRPDEHAQRARAPRSARGRRSPAGHAEPRAAARRPSGRRVRATASAHSTRTGRRLPSSPFRNGSGNEPTTAGTSLGLAPVVAIPPDVIAGVHVRRGGALRGLDAVDVVEPVDRLPRFLAAGEAVDALHEAAAEAGGDGRSLRISRLITVSCPRTLRRCRSGAATRAPKSRVTSSWTALGARARRRARSRRARRGDGGEHAAERRDAATWSREATRAHRTTIVSGNDGHEPAAAGGQRVAPGCGRRDQRRVAAGAPVEAKSRAERRRSRRRSAARGLRCRSR